MAEPGIWDRRELGMPYLDYELIVICSGPEGSERSETAAVSHCPIEDDLSLVSGYKHNLLGNDFMG